MPNICTHIAFGVRVAEAVQKPLASLGEYYRLGCLGPDWYFYDRLPPTPFIPHQHPFRTCRAFRPRCRAGIARAAVHARSRRPLL